MQSPLHERLEYLVNYSSQLIFVSGDSVAQQQKTLEAFVFNQNDDTDIAYLTAKPELDLSDYRRQLCHQLIGQLVGSYVRPLNELLADLNQHQGPVLITITQAEHLPDGLLQELWDLVLQSRFDNNKQHLNVLLFGQPDWAEKAKQWLPAKNTNTPLLISSQSVMAQQVGSELDQLISQRRLAFQARLDERTAAQQIVATNRLKSPWFWGGAVLTFLFFFSALIAWQYSNELSALFSPIEEMPLSEEAVMPAPGTAYRELLENTAPSDAEDDSTLVSKLVTPDAAEQDSQSTTKSQEKLKSSGTNSTPGQPTITDWQTAVADMNQKRSVSHQRPGDERSVDSEPTEIIEPETSAPQIDSSFASKFMAEASAQPSPSIQQPAEAANLLDNTMLASLLTPEDVVIQLAGLKDEKLLRDFVGDHQLQDKVWIYQTQRYGGPWHVLLFKQPFGSITEARQAMALLPEYPGKQDAFVKSADQVLRELQAGL